MSDTHGGAVVATHLRQAGITHLFTLCGGHISPILVEAKRQGIRVVDVRSEASAVFAADAHARLTGRPGVAVVTAGPGVTNTITAVKNAQMAQSPVLIIGGATPTLLKNRGSLQDIDQLSLMKSLVKWQTSVRTLPQMDEAMRYGLSVAREGVPGPVFVEAPIDLLYPRAMVREMFAEQAGIDRMPGMAGTLLRAAMNTYLWRQERQPVLRWHPGFSGWRDRAGESRAAGQVSEVARLLAGAERPALVLGSQVLVNRDQASAAQIAEAIGRLGVPCWTGGMARGLLGAEHELLFRHKRGKALARADVVLVAGFPFDFRMGYGRGFARGAKIISVNLSRHDLKMNRRPDVAVNCHPGDLLTRLADEARPGDYSAWMQGLRENESAREAEIDEQAGATSDQGINPVGFFRKLDASLDEGDILVVDGGDFVATGAYTLKPRQPLSWLDPGVYGTLGVGGGFALGAGMARPDDRIWLIYGDGSSAYSLAEFDTYVRMGMAPIAVVGTDASWGQIAREQEAMLGDNIGTYLRKTDYQTVAEGYGGEGILVTRDEDISAALAQARATAATGKPVCINLHLAPSGFRKGSISM